MLVSGCAFHEGAGACIARHVGGRQQIAIQRSSAGVDNLRRRRLAAPVEDSDGQRFTENRRAVAALSNDVAAEQLGSVSAETILQKPRCAARSGGRHGGAGSREVAVALHEIGAQAGAWRSLVGCERATGALLLKDDIAIRRPLGVAFLAQGVPERSASGSGQTSLSVGCAGEAGLVSASRIHRPDLIDAATPWQYLLIHNRVWPAVRFAPRRMLGVGGQLRYRPRMDAHLRGGRAGKKTESDNRPHWK